MMIFLLKSKERERNKQRNKKRKKKERKKVRNQTEKKLISFKFIKNVFTDNRDKGIIGIHFNKCVS